MIFDFEEFLRRKLRARERDLMDYEEPEVEDDDG